MSQKQKSIYQQYEDATRSYYGADRDPLKLVPVATDKNVANELALQAERQLGSIREEDIVASAVRAMERNKYSHGHDTADFETLKQDALDHQLRRAVVNVELTHASLAPEDFNEDAVKSGAYEMGAGQAVLPPQDEQPKG